jgi:serine/threonine protein phosphatase PrpC
MVSVEAETGEYQLEWRDRIIVLACDGLWDMSMPHEVSENLTEYSDERRPE